MQRCKHAHSQRVVETINSEHNLHNLPDESFLVAVAWRVYETVCMCACMYGVIDTDLGKLSGSEEENRLHRATL